MDEFSIWIGGLWTGLNTLSWPLAVVILAVIFRQTVIDLARAVVNFSQRVKSFAGVEFQQIEQIIDTPEQEVPLSAVLDGDTDLEPWGQPLEAELRQTSYSGSELKTRLVRALAWTRRARHFDNILRSIFVTQIEALKKLNQDATTKKGLQRFYQDHMQRVTAAGLTAALGDFDSWLAYLLTIGFVTKDATGPYYRITSHGKAFLKHEAMGQMSPVQF